MKSIFFFAVLMLSVFTLRAQEDHDDHEGHVHGKVVTINEKGKPEGLPGAMVYWANTTLGTFTNSSGKFTLDTTDETHLLVAAYIGYISDTLLFHDDDELIFQLEPTSDLQTIQIVEQINATMLNLRDAQLSQTMTEKELCKAACCNLSESFETNASIDASFTDAVTGTRQIKMLGLEGRYTQIMFDNIPSVRGLASIYGLSYLPGPWIREISISKGVGSVINGHESITGQINVAHKNATMKERLFINAYAGSQGRLEFNSVLRQPVGQRWNTMLFVHGAMSELRFDMNNDGFLDNPLFRNAVLRNEWSYTGKKGLRGEYTASYHHLQNTSGQFDFDPSDEIRRQLWGVDITTDRYEFSGKTGYVFEQKDGMSLGSQVSAMYHDQRGRYGHRQYNGNQLSGRANLLFASEYSEEVKQTSGVSFVYDEYVETLDSLDFSRTEQTFGIFSEHTYTPNEDWSIIAGIRGDYHNTYGFFVTPRLHARYSFNENTSLKLAAGMGYRSPNLLMDNVGLFASNRTIQIQTSEAGAPYGMKMEEAINLGLVFTRKFKIFHRDATVAVDIYRTDFNQQIVVDWETPTVVKFYQLDGPSYSNSAQVEMQWSPIRRLEMRLAYRWLEAKTQYGNEVLMRPLIAQHRAFTNLEYSTKEKDNGAKWMFDLTVRWLGEQRLPNTAGSPHEYHLHSRSDDFFIINAQISKHFNSKFEVYVGGENLGNFMQMSPIISADNPESPYFDASMIWGPVFGRMGYVGLRWRIGQ